jgi:ribosomal protein S18 acetylase RimI-like enzyme
MEVRIAEHGDYDLLLPLFLELREFSRAGHPPQEDDFDLVLAASREYLREVLGRGSGCQTLLALDGGSLAGYLVVTIHKPNPLSSSGVARSGSIDELIVSDAYRGQRVGNLLIDTACVWLTEQQAERVEVSAYAWNTAGIRFYEREGFAPWTITFTKSLPLPLPTDRT